MKEFYVVFTLGGNLKLVDKLLDSHELEIELYANTLDEAKALFKEHKKFLKAEGLL